MLDRLEKGKSITTELHRAAPAACGRQR